ncbi:class I SAM-dependent methyltransferase [Cohnella caldifontis]|uniref:class I SAM-dependent methyltransferase n=1 Tax=Cohnella caldifontis TaxID=3027471 RepID=UPI0023EBD13A|nr:class I SAM-dependent methyltransferase [Cohnella sp. YIM B05605]
MYWIPDSLRWLAVGIGAVCLITALVSIVEALYMVWSSKVGKLRVRERLLDLVGLRGNERVLDVGCGRGLLLVAAARRLTTGKAVGVDIWNLEDQSGNGAEAAWRNARREGTEDRVDIKDGDARDLPFADGTFDVVISSLAVHNISDPGERTTAIREMMRVLKPGGRFAVLDFRHAREYAGTFERHGAADVRIDGPHWRMFPPVRIVNGIKPPAGA